MEQPHIISGRLLTFADVPLGQTAPEDATLTDGALLIKGGKIAKIGEPAELLREAPDARRISCGDAIIAPGFVDCHNHYSQTRIIASWGKRLIDWLNGYTFPEEAKFSDRSYADAVAQDYLDFLVANGVTTAAAYCTIHPESVDALFTVAEARGMRITAGKVMMDRNAPDNLKDTAQSGYDESAALIDRWRDRGRLTYAITPRFAPTSTQAQLEAAGALWALHPDLPMQTHLSEQSEEIAWVGELFPQDEDYLAVYERYGLCGPGAIMGHSIHLTARERAALRETGAGVAHCPTSNTFIGSGLCDVSGLADSGVPIGLATDVGGGSSFSMLTTMRAAYEIGQLRGQSLSPAFLWRMATEGSAQVLRQEQSIGRIAVGMEADLIALTPSATPVLAQRAARAESVSDLLFAVMILGDDRAIAETWIAGAPQKNGFA